MKAQIRLATPAELRNFGFIVGCIFALIALWPVLMRAENPRLWAMVVSGILLIPALTFPTLLGPVYRVWMRMGAALGWVNTRIILGLSFYGLFTPMAAVMRLFGRDPLHRRFDAGLATYRVNKSARPGSHMKKPF